MDSNEFFIKRETYWIGFNDIEKEGNFIWINSSIVDYKKWNDENS